MNRYWLGIAASLIGVALALGCDRAGTSAESKPGAAPAKPTVYGAAELAKVLDFTKLKLPEGTEAFDLTPARATFKCPGKLDSVWPQFKDQFAKLGWKSLPDREQKTDEYIAATLSKDGHLATVSVSKMGDKPETPETMVSLNWHGNLDARKLPRVDGGETTYEDQSTEAYRTKRPVEEEYAAVLKLLTADGWIPYRRKDGPDTEQGTKENRFAKLMKQGYDLDLMVGVAPAAGNKTHIQYNVSVLSHDFPLPPKASDLRLNDDRWELQCRAADDFLTVGKYYEKQLVADGYEKLKSEQPQEKYWNQRFKDRAGNMLLIQTTAAKGGTSTVLITGIPEKVVKELEKEK